VLQAARRGQEAAPPFYPDKTKLLVHRTPDGVEHAITSAADWPKRRAHILANMQEVMGPLPDASRRVPLDVRVSEEVTLGNYIRSPYVSGSLKAIWNNMRAVDLLQALPEVDPERIGCIGHSLGGHNTMFTAAFDTRIKALVSNCGFTSFPKYYGGHLKGWTSIRYMPRIRDVYGMNPERVPFDFTEVVAARAPRAFF